MPRKVQERLKHLGRERDHLFTFLRHPELDIPATNWRAEQGIRPAVMIRKTWGGNAIWKGARIQECLMSVCRTGRLQGVDVIGVNVKGKTSRRDRERTRRKDR